MSRPVSCVLDASVGIKLVVPEDDSNRAVTLLSDPGVVVHVPDLFFLECANILWKKVRRGEYAAADTASALARLRETDPSVALIADLVDQALVIANAEDISAYDACYVALAERLGVPLVTADDRLAAKLAGTAHQVLTLGGL